MLHCMIRSMATRSPGPSGLLPIMGMLGLWMLQRGVAAIALSAAMESPSRNGFAAIDDGPEVLR
jgi:hypothetical protein